MLVKLGYVSISERLGKKVTTSSNVTFANYNKQNSKEEKLEKLKSVSLSNLQDLEKILKYNIENDIFFYRITSGLIPLVTHPQVGYWGHREIFKKEFENIGKIIKESNMRVDTHPNQFNVLNSVNENVIKNTIENLTLQVEWFEDMKYKLGKMVVHVGGGTNGKDAGIERFLNTFKILPQSISEKIIIENDDKIYTARDVLNICKKINIPMVLDVHHHNCNNSGEKLEDIIKDIFDTWKDEELCPKIHFSSPKELKYYRRHSEYICAEDFVNFIDMAKNINYDFDVMLECKKKDEALFKLVHDIRILRPSYKWLNKTTFKV